MNKLNYLLILLIIIALNACKDEPIIPEKNFPYFETNEPVVTEDGAIFSIDNIQNGVDTITAYGFNYKVNHDYDTYYYTIKLTDTVKSNEIKYVLDHNLINGFSYTMQAYIKTKRDSIVGPSHSFVSKGSRWNPWEKQNVNFEGNGPWGTSIGFSCNDRCFIAYGSGHVYEYNPDISFCIVCPDLPFSHDPSSYFAGFSIGNDIFLISADSKRHYKYNINTKKWEDIGSRPIGFTNLQRAFGISMNNLGYYISRYNLFEYDPETNKRTELSFDKRIYEIYDVCATDNEIYVFAKYNRLWKFTKINGWEIVGEYTEKVVDKNLFCFSSNNIIYYGFINQTIDYSYYSPKTNSFGKLDKFFEEIHDFPGIISRQGDSYLFQRSGVWRFDNKKVNLSSE